MIYVIYNEANKHIKIGFSNNPEKRLKNLQTANSSKLILLHKQEGELNEEKVIHNELKDHCLVGEWYEYSKVRNLLPTLLKGWVDIEMDYVQVYNNIFQHTVNLKSKYGLQYVLFIMGKCNERNMIPHNDSILQEFCDKFDSKPSIGTIRNAITELVKEKIFLKYSSNSYQLNPQIFWSDGKNERVENILEIRKKDIVIEEKTKEIQQKAPIYIKEATVKLPF